MIASSLNTLFPKRHWQQLGALVLLCLLPFGLYAQWEDDSPAPKPQRWRWKHYLVKQVTVQGNRQQVVIELDRNDVFQFEDGLWKAGTYKTVKSGEVGNFDLKIGTTDSLLAQRPAKPGDKGFVNISLPYLSARLVRDEKNYKKFLECTLPANAQQTLAAGDLVDFRIKDEWYNDSLLLYRLADYRITLLTFEPKPFFHEPDFRKTAADEMEAVKMLLADLKEAGAYYKDKMTTAFASTGRYAGKTVSQILEMADERLVLRCLNFMATYAREYIGRQVKFAEVYAVWARNGETPGTIGPLKIEQEFNRWLPVRPIVVNVDAGQVDGAPLKQALVDFQQRYPWFNGSEKDEEEPGTQPYCDYQLLGNGLTYFPRKKVLKLMLAVHQYGSLFGLKEYTPAEIRRKLGAPARLVGPAARPERMLYSRPFGTLEFSFTGFNESATLVYLHAAPPAQAKPAED